MVRQVGRPGIDPDIEKLQAGQDDPDEWDEAPAAIRVRPTTTSVVSFRVSHDELERLQSIAGARGESISDFVRDSIRVRIGHLSDPDPAAGGEHAVTTAGTPELEAIARIDGIDVPEMIRTALAAHVAARRRDPTFRTRLRQEQTLLNALLE
jgi:hypothetical protein